MAVSYVWSYKAKGKRSSFCVPGPAIDQRNRLTKKSNSLRLPKLPKLLHRVLYSQEKFKMALCPRWVPG